MLNVESKKRFPGAPAGAPELFGVGFQIPDDYGCIRGQDKPSIEGD